MELINLIQYKEGNHKKKVNMTEMTEHPRIFQLQEMARPPFRMDKKKNKKKTLKMSSFAGHQWFQLSFQVSYDVLVEIGLAVVRCCKWAKPGY